MYGSPCWGCPAGLWNDEDDDDDNDDDDHDDDDDNDDYDDGDDDGHGDAIPHVPLQTISRVRHAKGSRLVNLKKERTCLARHMDPNEPVVRHDGKAVRMIRQTLSIMFRISNRLLIRTRANARHRTLSLSDHAVNKGKNSFRRRPLFGCKACVI